MKVGAAGLAPMHADKCLHQLSRTFLMVTGAEPKSLMVFFQVLPKLRIYLYVRLINGAAGIFLTSYAATGNRTCISLVAPLMRDLNP